MRKTNPPAFFVAVFVLIMIASAGFFDGIVKAEFKPPKDIGKYIPPGFTIDEQYSGTKDYGMYVATNVLATKANILPHPFKTPELARLKLGYMAFADRSMAAMAWQDALANAEKNTKNDYNPMYAKFIGKENISGGGVIYWYQGTDIKAQYDAKGGYILKFYQVEFYKQINNGVLQVKIEDIVADQDAIRKWFQ